MQNEGLDIQGILNIFAGLHLQDNHLSPPPHPHPVDSNVILFQKYHS